MIALRSLLGLHFILSTLFQRAVADLQNVTVDDAVLTGDVIPQYLPSVSSWNQGDSCSKCLVKPDPALAYNQTWHDTTFDPRKDVSQAIEFTFTGELPIPFLFSLAHLRAYARHAVTTGSAVYIFFIIANTVRSATTLTDVVFYLDDVAVGEYTHAPTTSTDYEYNVSVYANASLGFGTHSMAIEPVDTGNSVLMLFDYLVYTTNVNDMTTASAASSTASTPTSTGTPAASSKPNAAAIVGGIIGGICGLVLVVIVSLLCYRRRRQLQGPRLIRSQGPLLGSLSSFHEPSYRGPPRTYRMDSLPYEVPSGRRQIFPVTLRPPSVPISIDPPSTISESAGLAAQVEELRGEVSRLLFLHSRRQNLGPEKT